MDFHAGEPKVLGDEISQSAEEFAIAANDQRDIRTDEANDPSGVGIGAGFNGKPQIDVRYLEDMLQVSSKVSLVLRTPIHMPPCLSANLAVRRSV
jgi:hypothetical protein